MQSKSSLLVLAALVVTAAATSAVPPATNAAEAAAQLRDFLRATRHRVVELERPRRQSAVEIGGINYTNHGDCIAASDARMEAQKAMAQAFLALMSAEQQAEYQSRVASMDTCPISLSTMACSALSDACIGLSTILPEVGAQFDGATACSAASTACVSYFFSMTATIASNPTLCAFAHQYEAEDADQCNGAVIGPRLGNSNVSVADGDWQCIGCSGSNVVRIRNVFYGQRDAAGHPTCMSSVAEDRLEDHCDGKPTCYFGRDSSSSTAFSVLNNENLVEVTLPAARASAGVGTASCNASNASTKLQVEFTCVSPATVSTFGNPGRIQALGRSFDEFFCVKDSSGQYCGDWIADHRIFTNLSFHNGHLSAEQCQSVSDANSCCWASHMDVFAEMEPSGDPAAVAHLRAIFDGIVASCADHGIPIQSIVGTWEGQDEHCGTASSIQRGTGGTAAEHSVTIDDNVNTKSGSRALAPSLLLAAALALMSI